MSSLLIEWNNYFLVLSSQVKELLGDDWVQRRRRIVQQHATQYKRVSWGKV
jgi:exocyst complex protein 7